MPYNVCVISDLDYLTPYILLLLEVSSIPAESIAGQYGSGGVVCGTDFLERLSREEHREARLLDTHILNSLLEPRANDVPDVHGGS